jgi:hypothetical protein
MNRLSMHLEADIPVLCPSGPRYAGRSESNGSRQLRAESYAGPSPARPTRMQWHTD